MLNEKNVSIIPATIKIEKEETTKKTRIGAYCRVSTDLEEQSSSYEAQVDYFKNYVNKRPNYKLIDVYADEGITGTNTKKRKEFNRLIDDCMKGKIDLVITKSISRFARNTIDTISYVKKLKEKGVEVYFEKENLSTFDPNTELVLTILSAMAQEESRSISTNCKWGIKRRFENGEAAFVTNANLGYKRDENNKIIIDDTQAEIVKLIFKLYLDGYSYTKIKTYLEENNYKTAKGLTTWQCSTIQRILSNEKYTGNSILQKTISLDYLSKKRKKNEGEENQYYVENSHVPIISQDIYNSVQEEIKRRSCIDKKVVTSKKKSTSKGKYSSKYVFSEILFCSECGKNYKRQIWKHYTPTRNVWRCINRLEHGKKYCKHSQTVDEDIVKNAVIMAINELIPDDSNIKTIIENNIKLGLENNDDTTYIDDEIKQIKDEIMKEVLEDLNSDNTDESKYVDRQNKIKQLEFEKLKMKNSNNTSRYMNIINQVSKTSIKLDEYEEVLTRKLIEKIIVLSSDTFNIYFKGGMEKKIFVAKSN